MTTTRTFDLVVIGIGAGGSGAAYRCRRAGWQVAIVNDLPGHSEFRLNRRDSAAA